ncbi:unnamed protein product [Camellia sinensis]
MSRPTNRGLDRAVIVQTISSNSIAVVLIGDEEVHLVAMPSKQKKFLCFWCYAVPSGLYNACLGMLNLWCLSIVFDLDETLIVANTMKSFEDRIEALRSWIARKTDPICMSGMTAEMKRYVDDRALLNFKISLNTSQRNFKISLDSPNLDKFSEKHFQRFSHPENFSGLHNSEKIPRQIFPEQRISLDSTTLLF